VTMMIISLSIKGTEQFTAATSPRQTCRSE